MTFEQIRYRAELIDGIVNTALVAAANRQGKTEIDKNIVLDQFDIRSAVALAISLVDQPDQALVDMMNKVVVG